MLSPLTTPVRVSGQGWNGGVRRDGLVIDNYREGRGRDADRLRDGGGGRVGVVAGLGRGDRDGAGAVDRESGARDAARAGDRVGDDELRASGCVERYGRAAVDGRGGDGREHDGLGVGRDGEGAGGVRNGVVGEAGVGVGERGGDGIGAGCALAGGRGAIADGDVVTIDDAREGAGEGRDGGAGLDALVVDGDGDGGLGDDDVLRDGGGCRVGCVAGLRGGDGDGAGTVDGDGRAAERGRAADCKTNGEAGAGGCSDDEGGPRRRSAS